MQDVFYRAKETYTQKLNPIKQYVDQLSCYIQYRTQCSAEHARAQAVKITKERFRDRRIKCFEREDNGDRVVKDATLMGYIQGNLKAGNILTPTFTSYMGRERRKSILSEFIFVAVSKRKIAKAEAHRAKAAGNTLLADNKNNEQNNLKTYSNSMSGAFAQAACILHNPSNHSTLTSITRTITSMSNANNERVIAGNRYYPRAVDVLHNLVYIVSQTNEAQVREAIQTWSLHEPSVEDTVQVLRRSSDLYFRDERYYQDVIRPFLTNLSAAMRASICYSGDLYHLRIFNPELVRRILSELSRKVYVQEQDPEIEAKLCKVDENIVNMVRVMFFDELKGRGKDYDKMAGSGVPESIYATCQHAAATLLRYQSFFSTFFMTEMMPPNSFRLKNMARRAVVLSDTDSTCFTLDEWVKWYKGGEFIVDAESIGMSAVVSFMVTQVIVNLLRVLSRNLNIAPELIDKLGMKNEFLWLAHAPAEVSKHYYAYTVVQEGQVHAEAEIEIKGVHLKNSAVPAFVIDDGKALMQEILERVSNNQKVHFGSILQRVIQLERNIDESVRRGETMFLKNSKINAASSYAEDETKSPYARHTFWQEVFAPRYGELPEPPYSVIKVPTTVQTKTALTQWVESIEDTELRARFAAWVQRNDKKNLPTVYLSQDYVRSNGIPQEILSVVDSHRIILDVTTQHRVILETLGVVLHKDRLLCEQFETVASEKINA